MRASELSARSKQPLAAQDEVREQVTPEVLGHSGLKRLVQDRSGIIFEGSSLTSLCRAVTRRMQERGIRTVPEYEHLLRVRDDARELDELVALVVVLKTSLFRDRPQFEFLAQHVFPEWNALDRPIRIWSAGCATGEEAYSLAIALLNGGLGHGRASVLATDLSRRALDRAEAGVYPDRHLEDIPTQEKVFFREVDGGQVAVNDRVRAMIEFRHHNLVSPPYPLPPEGAWDAVFCRNVMIYFDRQTTKEILERFHRVLAPGGLLFVGASESLYQLSDAFTLCDPARAFIYRRLEKTGAGQFAAPAPVAPVRPAIKSRPVPASPVRTPPRREPVKPPRASVPPVAEAAPEEQAFGAATVETLLAEADRSETAQALHRLAEASPEQAAPKLALGRLAADKGSLEEARSWLEAGLEIEPLDVDGRFLLAVVLYRNGMDSEAAGELRRLLFLSAGHALGHYYLGLVTERLGDMERAGLAYKNALDALQSGGELEGRDLLEGFESISTETLAAACRARLLSIPHDEEALGRGR